MIHATERYITERKGIWRKTQIFKKYINTKANFPVTFYEIHITKVAVISSCEYITYIDIIL